MSLVLNKNRRVLTPILLAGSSLIFIFLAFIAGLTLGRSKIFLSMLGEQSLGG